MNLFNKKEKIELPKKRKYFKKTVMQQVAVELRKYFLKLYLKNGQLYELEAEDEVLFFPSMPLLFDEFQNNFYEDEVPPFQEDKQPYFIIKLNNEHFSKIIDKLPSFLEIGDKHFKKDIDYFIVEKEEKISKEISIRKGYQWELCE